MLIGQRYSTVVAASVPFDNSTNTYVANNVEAAILETNIHLIGSQHLLSATYTLTTTDATLPGVTVTAPSIGTYFVIFTGDATSPTSGAAISISIYLAGTQVTGSLRKTIPFSGGTLTSGNARGLIGTNGIVTTTAVNEVIDIRGSVSTTASTVNSGTMSWIRLT